MSRCWRHRLTMCYFCWTKAVVYKILRNKPWQSWRLGLLKPELHSDRWRHRIPLSRTRLRERTPRGKGKERTRLVTCWVFNPHIQKVLFSGYFLKWKLHLLFVCFYVEFQTHSAPVVVTLLTSSFRDDGKQVQNRTASFSVSSRFRRKHN